MSAYNILLQRGVTRLCHFTKIQSLTHILASPDGILATTNIANDSKNQIDSLRADGELEYVCCSVEYPNSWFLEKAQDRNNDAIFQDWSVLYIRLDILNSRDVNVCECNAAKQYGKYIFAADDASVKNIFSKNVHGFPKPRPDQMLSCCPTNSQAEIMIKEGIPREYISGIAVIDTNTANIVSAMIKTLKLSNIDVYIAPEVISKRWRQKAEQGVRPYEEKIYSL